MNKTNGLVVLLVLVAGCGDDDGGAGADAAAGADVAVMIDAAPTPDGPIPATEGHVIVDETLLEGGGPTGGATIAFTVGNPFGAVLGSAGPCELHDAPAPNGSAGTITAGGLKVAVTLDPSDNGDGSFSYGTTPETLPADMFDPGDSIQLTAAGGPNVAAFSGAVVAPAKLAGVVMPAAISRAGGDAFTWTGDTSDRFLAIVIAKNSGAGTSNFLICDVDDSGTFTVPVAALALLPAGVDRATLILSRIDETNVTAGAAAIHLWAADAWVGNEIDITP